MSEPRYTMNDALRRPPAPDELRAEAVRRAARDAGFHDPSDAVRLLADADDDPERAVEQLAQRKPHLLTPHGVMNARLRGGAEPQPELEPKRVRVTGSADAGNAGPPTGRGADMNARIRAVARGMSVDDYEMEQVKRGERW